MREENYLVPCSRFHLTAKFRAWALRSAHSDAGPALSPWPGPTHLSMWLVTATVYLLKEAALLGWVLTPLLPWVPHGSNYLLTKLSSECLGKPLLPYSSIVGYSLWLFTCVWGCVASAHWMSKKHFLCKEWHILFKGNLPCFTWILFDIIVLIQLV